MGQVADHLLRSRRRTRPGGEGRHPGAATTAVGVPTGTTRHRSLRPQKRNSFSKKPVHNIVMSKKVLRTCLIADTYEVLRQMLPLEDIRWDTLTPTAQAVFERWIDEHDVRPEVPATTEETHDHHPD